MINNDLFLNNLLLHKIVDEKTLDFLREKNQDNSLNIMNELLENAICCKDKLGKIWGDCINIAYVNLDKTLIQTQEVIKLPEDKARKFKAIPIYKFGDVITIATSNPCNDLILNEIENIMGEKISPVFSFPEEIEYAIKINYRSQSFIEELSSEIECNSDYCSFDIANIEQLKIKAEDKNIVNFVDELILLAVKERASDIHIDNLEKVLEIRFRIDGVIQHKFKLSKNVFPILSSRLKVLANADIIEKRRPQDGRITLNINNRSINIRFSSMPTINGEKIVLRLLGITNTREIPSLEELEFSKRIHNEFKKIIETPNGIIFITGPTGSGKTTTLFSALKEINKPEINILSIEDPVEYRLSGVNQIQVNPNINLTFETALRSVLRQDPDVILLGEIRDAETAKIAAQAALTGHLVFTTLHTNNSIQAVTRLIEIGVESFLVAPSIIAVMAQRLVRKLCEHCKEEYELSSDQIYEIFSTEKIYEIDENLMYKNNSIVEKIMFYKPKGCKHCNYTGYFGRTTINELFIIDDETRRLISQNASITQIQEQAHKSGFKDLWYDGVKKVLQGITSIEEVKRILIS